MKGKLLGSYIINRTSKRVKLRPQKETTLEKLSMVQVNLAAGVSSTVGASTVLMFSAWSAVEIERVKNQEAKQ